MGRGLFDATPGEDRMPKIGRPSFCKILMKGYTSKLMLPHVFAQKYEEFLPESAQLRTNSEEIWDVKLEKTDNETYCFTGQGWNKFVKDLALELFEFLVFWFNIGESTFDVSVYGRSGCQREFSAMAVDSDADENFEFSNDHCHNVPGNDVQRLRFQHRKCGGELRGIKSFPVVVKKYSRHYMDIPKTFALETGVASKRAIRLQNVEGKEWFVKIRVMKDGRNRMTTGWNDFLVDNNLVCGSKCLFEFDATSGNLIMKKERETTNTRSSERRRGSPPMNMVIPAKRGRGRPPKNMVIVPTKRGRGRPHKNLAIC